MNVTHIINQLNPGGMEIFLLKICEKISDEPDIKQTIITLNDNNALIRALKHKPCYQIIELSSRVNPLTKFLLLLKIIKTINPSIIHTISHEANFYGMLASFFFRSNLIWNIRNSTLRVSGRLNKILLRLLAYSSYYFPKKIILVSNLAVQSYSNYGFSRKKMQYIPNGYDLKILKRNKAKGDSLKNSLGISKDAIIIGSAARFDFYKDHNFFVEVINYVNSISNKNIHFVLAGLNIDTNNQQLTNTIRQNQNVHLLGHIENMSSFYSSLDIFCLHSRSEGFPNVLVESMCFECVPISRKVGAAPEILKDVGFCIDSIDYVEFAEKVIEVSGMSKNARRLIGKKSRDIVSQKWKLDTITEKYIELFKKFEK